MDNIMRTRMKGSNQNCVHNTLIIYTCIYIQEFGTIV